MSVYIHHEILLFFQAVAMGAMLLLCYDCLRILRNTIPHSRMARSVEDLMYWLAAGFFTFGELYRTNQGILRGFVFVGMSLGAVLCSCTISTFFVKTGTLIFGIPVKIVNKLIKWLLFLRRSCKIFVYESVNRYFQGNNGKLRRIRKGRHGEKVSTNKQQNKPNV